MKDSVKRVGEFVIKMEAHLGEGTFATTYRAYRSSDEHRTPLACKIINKDNLQLAELDRKYFMERVREEYKALQKLKHPHIVELLGVEESKKNLYLFFQYCESNLAKYIPQHFFEKNHEEIDRFAAEMISACHYFTSLGVLHRDIKPQNILISGKSIKIADFGMATHLNLGNEQHTATFAGTPQFMAPQILEIMEDKGAKLKDIQQCDVWSVGVTLYQLTTNYLPFGLTEKDRSESVVLRKIREGKGEAIKLEGHEMLEELVRRMLVVDPKQRITFFEAKQMMNKLRGKHLPD